MWRDTEALGVRVGLHLFPLCFILLSVHSSLHLSFSYSSPWALLLSPSLALSSLARCHVGATGRSRLTDGPGCEAIRRWLEWNGTGPVHYQDSFLTSVQPERADGERRLFYFFINQTFLSWVLESDVTFGIPALLFCFGGTPVSFWGWGEGAVRGTCVCFFLPRGFDRCLPRGKTNPNSKCHHILGNKIVAVMWPRCWESDPNR